MEKALLPNNVTLAGLRKLLREAKKIVGEKEAVHIELSLWHYDDPPGGIGNIKEKIGLYRSEGKATVHVKSLKEAYKVLEEWKKEKTDGTS